MRPLSVIFLGYVAACVATYCAFMTALAIEAAVGGAPKPWFPIVGLFGVGLPLIFVTAAPGFIVLRAAIAATAQSPSFSIFVAAGALNAAAVAYFVDMPMFEWTLPIVSGAVGGFASWWSERAALRMRLKPRPEGSA